MPGSGLRGWPGLRPGLRLAWVPYLPYLVDEVWKAAAQ